MSTTPADETRLDTIFDQISSARGDRDAAARNCAHALLDEDTDSAIWYAQQFAEYQLLFEDRMRAMKELYPLSQK